MRSVAVLVALIASQTLGSVIPATMAKQGTVLKRAPEIEKAGASGTDDDDAIAYAWFTEDEIAAGGKRRRLAVVEKPGASGSDDDDAIAYAWFSEDE
ncbi:hypothetical protein F4805DRAFT_454949 [Annulohypoxylon moriforme]|nr:hypothetical protein F4805DRAFT_454949 [Annulohypoxylon moriforme]